MKLFTKANIAKVLGGITLAGALAFAAPATSQAQRIVVGIGAPYYYHPYRPYVYPRPYYYGYGHRVWVHPYRHGWYR